MVEDGEASDTLSDQTLTDLGPDFEIATGDTLVVAGTDEDLLTFQEVAGTLGE